MKRWYAWLLAAVLAAQGAMAEELTDVAQAYPALEAHRYADVEAYYDKLRRERTRLPGGEFLFEKFSWSIYWYSSDDPKEPDAWPKVDAATQAWVAHSPKSHLAAMTRAFVLAYRGAHLVNRGKWDEGDRLAAEARRLLDGTRASGESDIIWHAIGLRVASVEGMPRSDVIQKIHAAASLDPYPLRLWQEASIALSPDAKQVEDMTWLMRLAAQRTAAQEGLSMPARVLRQTYWRYNEFAASPFGRSGLQWEAVHASFLDWKKRYPASYDINLHGALACAARDRAVTADLLAQIGPGVNTVVWDKLGGKDYAKRCGDWAKEERENLLGG